MALEAANSRRIAALKKSEERRATEADEASRRPARSSAKRIGRRKKTRNASGVNPWRNTSRFVYLLLLHDGSLLLIGRKTAWIANDNGQFRMSI